MCRGKQQRGHEAWEVAGSSALGACYEHSRTGLHVAEGVCCCRRGGPHRQSGALICADLAGTCSGGVAVDGRAWIHRRESRPAWGGVGASGGSAPRGAVCRPGSRRAVAVGLSKGGLDVVEVGHGVVREEWQGWPGGR